jgi:ABC-type uncharacterized transport system permease subunit
MSIMSVTTISGLFAVSFYLVGAILQGLSYAGNKPPDSKVFTFGLLAVVAHAISAFGVIKSTDGYHFGIFEITTLITASISLSALISSLRKPLENLFLGLFPLAILSIIASLLISSNYPATEMSTGLAMHVLISILAFSFIIIAALQAGFLAYQNHQLKHHRTHGLIQKLPPLQDMEVFLFELLWVGECLLSLAIVAGFIFVDTIWAIEGVPHKIFFSVLAWVVFAVLLWGRHHMGWRGRTAIRGTLIGFSLLLVGFYGSKFVLEYLLQ